MVDGQRRQRPVPVVRGVRPGDIPGARDHRRQYPRRLAGRTSRGAQVCWSASDRPPARRGRRHTVCLAAANRDRVRLGAAQQAPIRFAAVFEVGMFEYDNTFVFMPLEASADLFPGRKRGHRARGVARKPGSRRNTRGQILRGPLARRWSHRRLAAGECQLLQCDQGGTQRYVPDPDADHRGRRVQHHFRS